TGATTKAGDHPLIYGDLTDPAAAAGGDDVIYGGIGADTIYAGAGNDQVWGSDGNDVIFGGPGDDILHGGSGDDWLVGETGNDQLFGDAGRDVLWGGTASWSGTTTVAPDDFRRDDPTFFIAAPTDSSA